MMFRLAVAQLRANRVFTVWTAGLMTVLVAILSYIVIAGATQVAFTRAEAELYGWDRESHGGVALVLAPAADEATGNRVAGAEYDATPSEFTAAFDSSRGHDAIAIAQGYLRTTPVDPDEPDSAWTDYGIDVVSVRGAAATPGLKDGVAPTNVGEIALAANVASRLEVSVGDNLTLYESTWNQDGQPSSIARTVTVVGVTVSTSMSAYDVNMPDAYVSWDEVTTPAGLLVSRSQQLDGSETIRGWVSVHWNGNDRSLDMYREPGWGSAGSSSFDLPHATVAWFGAAIALFVAMIVMSFAVGRSQASARTQWVATVRTMGARRSHIVAAATVEALVLAAIAVVAGTGLGVGIAQAALSLARAQADTSFGPSSIVWHWALVPVVLGVTAVVSIVVAAVPAFWASRTSPTAALKPVSDVTEAEVSRRVPLSWLIIPFAVGAALVTLGVFGAAAPIAATAVLGWVIVVVAGFALIVETLRSAIPAVGRAFARSHRPSLLTAGDALASRPRQAVAPALLMTVAVTLLTMWSCRVGDTAADYWRDADSAPQGIDQLGREYLRSSLLGFTTVSTIVIAALALQLVAAGIITSHRAATSRESAARRAMGLSRSAEAVAVWWQQWIPQVIGVGVGFVVGLVGFAASVAGSTSPAARADWANTVSGAGIGAAYAAAVAVAMLGLAAVVALIAAWSTRARTPLAALAPAG